MEGVRCRADDAKRYTSDMFTYPYPRPALTADAVVLRQIGDTPEVLLICRRFEPYAGTWALPGGFVEEWEAPEAAARRELAEETGLAWGGPLLLVGVYGKKGRDPRGWTVACAYLALIGHAEIPLAPDDDAAEAAWHSVDELPPVAFDHHDIIADALRLL